MANLASVSFEVPLLLVTVTSQTSGQPTGGPEIIRQPPDYWTHLLGPKFSAKERKQMNLSRVYSIAQIEYCRNFIFERNFHIHEIFERGCEPGLWRLTANPIIEIFGVRLTPKLPGKLSTVVDQIEQGQHVFRAGLSRRTTACSQRLSLAREPMHLTAIQSHWLLTPARRQLASSAHELGHDGK